MVLPVLLAKLSLSIHPWQKNRRRFRRRPTLEKNRFSIRLDQSYFRILVLYCKPFCMVYKGLCRIETLTFRVTYSWSALDIRLLWSSNLDFVLYYRCIRLFIESLQRSAHYRASVRFLVLHSGLFFMAYKDLCRIKSLAFRVAFTGSVHEILSFFTKSQVRFNRSLPFSCFVLSTVLYET